MTTPLSFTTTKEGLPPFLAQPLVQRLTTPSVGLAENDASSGLGRVSAKKCDGVGEPGGSG